MSAIIQSGLKAPFPWFGGKSRVAAQVWERFGDVPNYVEPFFGSGAVALGRPHAPRIETVNDIDCYVSNFWRALQAAPLEVARWADAPVNEADLHARHTWLINQHGFQERMKSDPDFFDAKIAGWWVWGISCWIGSGWCAQPDWAGRISGGAKPRGMHGQAGRGRRDVGNQIWHKRPALRRGERGVCRQLPQLTGQDGAAGRGVHASGKSAEGVMEWLQGLANRLRRVRVCCGDWKRVLGRSPTECIGVTGVFLDPPYSLEAGRDGSIYREDDLSIAHEVREWAIANGDNPKLRIALCGYEGEHEMPATWTKLAWKAHGGYGTSAAGKGKANSLKERIWFSPHCIKQTQADLFS